MCETFPARVERGGTMPPVEKLPYFPEQALEAFGEDPSAVVLAGARAPVAFFGYPNMPSLLIPEGRARRDAGDARAGRRARARSAGRPHRRAQSRAARAPLKRPAARPTGELDAATIGAAIAALMPEHAIVMDEAATTGLPFFGASLARRRIPTWR